MGHEEEKELERQDAYRDFYHMLDPDHLGDGKFRIETGKFTIYLDANDPTILRISARKGDDTMLPDIDIVNRLGDVQNETDDVLINTKSHLLILNAEGDFVDEYPKG
jgi:hypothetical protein